MKSVLPSSGFLIQRENIVIFSVLCTVIQLEEITHWNQSVLGFINNCMLCIFVKKATARPTVSSR